MLRFLLLFAFLINFVILFIQSLPLIGQPIFKGLLNQTQQAELHSILFTPNASKAAIKSAVAKWVEKQSSELQVCTFNFVFKGLFYRVCMKSIVK